jgi:tetratricopeptide (TPR) repeat protein
MQVKKIWSKIFIALFFIFIFLSTANSIPDWDAYFHIKSGEVIAQQGVIDHDVFSQAEQSRHWYAHEWLFQLGLFSFVKAFGFEALKFFVGFFATLQIAIIYLIFRKIFKLHIFASFVLCLSYMFLCYNVFVPRPQLAAQCFFFMNFFLILLYLHKDKNFLFFSLPLVYIWSNFHISAVLNNVLFFGYTILCFIFWAVTKEKSFLKKSLILFVYSLLGLAVSMLPPTGIVTYQYLGLYLNYHEIFSKIIELSPLYQFSSDFIVYLGLILLIVVPICIFAFRRREQSFVWILPVFIWLFFGFTTLRSTYYGYFALLIIIAWFLSTVKLKKLTTLKQSGLVGLIIIFLCFSGWMLYARLKTVNNYTSHQELAGFIQKSDLKGNMFNEITYGSYLLYRFYPERKVFIDARLDVYLCCEFPDYLALEDKITLPGEEFEKALYALFEKYHINYAILPTRIALGLKIIDVLDRDKNWVLVFWNDREAIYVKDDTVNTHVLKKFGTTAATPFLQLAYKEKAMDQALTEYLRIDTLTKSALTKNNIASIYMKKGDLMNAKKYLEQAIEVDENFVSAYTNLAEVYIGQGDRRKAIEWYEAALLISPGSMASYPRLATIYYSLGEKEKAKIVLEKGRDKAPTEQLRMIFEENLKKL